MNLKLVVASMSVLGLISCPIFAATQTKHKHHHHHRKCCHTVRVTPIAVQAPIMPLIPVLDTSQIIYDGMSQNLGRSIHPTPDWFQRIAVIGGINFDAHWGNRQMDYMGENNRRLALNDAYLNATALVNEWTKAFMSVSFNNTSGFGTNATEVINSVKGGVYSNAYSNNRLNLEQGYITFANFNCSPFFVQLGKQFQDFGRYQIHPIERTLTQVLTESNQTSAKAGFITPMGFHGSVYAFDDSLIKVGNAHTSTIYGAALGYDLPCEQLGYDIGVGYMSSITGVNDVAYAIRRFELLATGTPNTVGYYNRTVGAWSVYADVNSGPFGLSLRYVSATRKYGSSTFSKVFRNTVAPGAQPSAADITAGYSFTACCKNQNIYLGYQVSNDAVNLLIPKDRWILGYGIDIWKNATLGAELGRDRDYNSGHGGTGRTSGTIGARAAVRFG